MANLRNARRLAIAATVIVFVLVGLRIYNDGPINHWLRLELQLGDVKTRRAAALQVYELELKSIGQNIADALWAGDKPGNTKSEAFRSGRRKELLFPVLLRLANESDITCRINVLKSIHMLAVTAGNDADKRIAYEIMLLATSDPNSKIKATALGCLFAFAAQDEKAVLKTLELALTDPTLDVRLAAVRELGILEWGLPEKQVEITSILLPIAVGDKNDKVRMQALWSLCSVDLDEHRFPPQDSLDVVSAIVFALQDPNVDIRRTAAQILESTTTRFRDRSASAWRQSRDRIVPVLTASLSDHDEAVQEHAALALLALGERDRAVVERIEQAIRRLQPPKNLRFVSAYQELLNTELATD